MQEDLRPFPSDEELITRLEALFYQVRLAAKAGQPTDLIVSDMRPVVLLRMLKLAIVFACAIADKKRISANDAKLLFVEMRMAERKARQ